MSFSHHPSHARAFRLVIVGGGPAGLAILLAAQRAGALERLLDGGVAIVEASATLGSGSIGGHALTSDSGGSTFVDCLRHAAGSPLDGLARHPIAAALAAAGEGAVQLQDVGAFLDLAGDALGRHLDSHPACAVLTQRRAECVQRVGGRWRVRTSDGAGSPVDLFARHVVLATGGSQPAGRLASEHVAGVNLMARYGEKLLQSGDVLAHGGAERVAQRTAGRAPRIVVVGGSTSAVSVCSMVLNQRPSLGFGPGGVTLLHRRELRLYYPDAASARLDGCTDFTDADVCPVTGRVFRLAGLRLDSRELIMRVRGIGGRPPEPRLQLHRLLQPHDPVAVGHLEAADVIVAAFGYRPRALPVLDKAGREVKLLAQSGPREPLVDASCRVLGADGKRLAALYGIGLAAGYVPHGALGGERSFVGQANGLWTWQNDVGALIVGAVLETGRKSVPRAKVPTAWPVDSAAPAFAAALGGV